MKTFCTILAVLALSLIAISANAEKEHIIYIDAGSTDTRLHIYEYSYNSNPASRGEPIEINDIHTVSAKSLGLKKLNTIATDMTLVEKQNEMLKLMQSVTVDAFSTKSAKIGDELLKPLLEDAENFLSTYKVTALNQEQIEIYLYGTAGMREMASIPRNRIYTAAREYVRNYSLQHATLYPAFYFTIPEKDNFKNLDPKLEALYGWLDVNYLSGTFTNNQCNYGQGSIDMGGASLEIAYAVSDDELKKTPRDDPNIGIYNLHIGKNNYNVIAASIDGLGHEASRNSLLMSSIEAKNYCFPPGDYKFVNINKYMISSSFNLDRCKKAYTELVNTNLTLNTISQSIKNSTNDSSAIPFIAFSGIYKAYISIIHSSSVEDQLTIPKPEELDQKIRDVCDVRLNKKLNPEDNRDKYCPNIAYINQVLFDTLNLKSRLLLADSIQNSNETNEEYKHLEWPLGAVLRGLI